MVIVHKYNTELVLFMQTHQKQDTVLGHKGWQNV